MVALKCYVIVYSNVCIYNIFMSPSIVVRLCGVCGDGDYFRIFCFFFGINFAFNVCCYGIRVFNTENIIVIPIEAIPFYWCQQSKYHDALEVWNRWNCWWDQFLALTFDCVWPTPNSVRTQSINWTMSFYSNLCIPLLSQGIQLDTWIVHNFQPAIFHATSISHCEIVPLSAIL